MSVFPDYSPEKDRCARLACPNTPRWVCTNCDTAYCEFHPPLTDNDPTKCDACGEPVREV